MSYEEIKRKYNLTDEKVGQMFGYKNKMSFSNAARKRQITKGIEELYRIFTLNMSLNEEIAFKEYRLHMNKMYNEAADEERI